MTLRTRLAAILAALVALGLVVSGIATYGALQRFLFERVDGQLRATQPLAVRALIDSQRPGPGPRPPALPIAAYAEVRSADGEVVASVAYGSENGDVELVPDVPPDAGAHIGTPFTAGAVVDDSYRFRVLVSRLPSGGELIVAIPLADAQQTLDRLLWIEMVVAAAILAALILVARIVIRREMRPLDEMADDATAIAEGDMSRRVVERAPGTEVGRLGRALNVMLTQIEQAFGARRASEERMRRFLGDASHELRTPLTSIRGYAELFRRGAEERPEDLRLSMRRIEDEAARMGVLVDELLLLANSDEVRPMEVTEIDLEALLEDAAAGARIRAPERSIELTIGEPIRVKGDEVRLRQAVDNLINNALVHTPPSAAVAIRLQRDADTAVIVVEDEGGGLDEEVLEHAFDRFWRSDSSRSRATGGAGLGLPIVQAIVRGHGGEVRAGNTPHGGASFTIELPAAPAPSLPAGG